MWFARANSGTRWSDDCQEGVCVCVCEHVNVHVQLSRERGVVVYQKAGAERKSLAARRSNTPLRRQNEGRRPIRGRSLVAARYTRLPCAALLAGVQLNASLMAGKEPRPPGGGCGGSGSSRRPPTRAAARAASNGAARDTWRAAPQRSRYSLFSPIPPTMPNCLVIVQGVASTLYCTIS